MLKLDDKKYNRLIDEMVEAYSKTAAEMKAVRAELANTQDEADQLSREMAEVEDQLRRYEADDDFTLTFEDFGRLSDRQRWLRIQAKRIDGRLAEEKAKISTLSAFGSPPPGRGEFILELRRELSEIKDAWVAEFDARARAVE